MNKMKKQFNKTPVLFLCLIMLFGAAPLNDFVVYDIKQSDSFLKKISYLFTIKLSAETISQGELMSNDGTVNWLLDDEGTLTISGTGEIDDHAFESCTKLSSFASSGSLKHVGKGYC